MVNELFPKILGSNQQKIIHLYSLCKILIKKVHKYETIFHLIITISYKLIYSSCNHGSYKLVKFSCLGVEQLQSNLGLALSLKKEDKGFIRLTKDSFVLHFSLLSQISINKNVNDFLQSLHPSSYLRPFSCRIKFFSN